jgi:hypothetical protein
VTERTIADGAVNSDKLGKESITAEKLDRLFYASLATTSPTKTPKA